MYTSALDYWYNRGKTHAFSITCSCGEKMKGIIRKHDKSDKLHCDCGLVWEVNKPFKEESK